MSPRELRKLYHKLERLQKKAGDFYWKKIKEERRAEHSTKLVRALKKRIMYWMGKRRALKCPAFKVISNKQDCKCFVHGRECVESYRSLFCWSCALCTLTPAQARVRGTFNSIFGKGT